MKILAIVLATVLWWGHARAAGIVFSQNKGQFPKEVLFKADFPEGCLFVEKGGLTFVLRSHGMNHANAHSAHSSATHGDEKEQYHCYKVLFVNPSARCSVSPGEVVDGTENFFIGNNPASWVRKVRSFTSVTYHNLWDGIDLVLYQYQNRIKYDFVVEPGALLKNICLRYKGVDSMYLTNNEVVLKTSLGVVVERKPFAYHRTKAGKDSVPTFYVFNKLTNELSFRVKKHKSHKTLIIDPEIVFSTYSGSYADNWGFTATFDRDKNVYSGGIANSIGYPASAGAYQESYRGNWDVAIIKYNPAGTQRIYATYLGGLHGDMVHSTVVNSKNQLVLYGTTGSSDFPVKNGFDNTFGGGTALVYDDAIRFPVGIDLFVATLSPDGSDLVASTFVGGTGNDGLNFSNSIPDSLLQEGNGALYYNYGDGARGEVIVDTKDNVYVGSCTFSTDFPVVNGFQQQGKGAEEGVVFKLTPDLSSLVWSSYVSGSGDDAVYSIDIDRNNNIYVSGGTNSGDMPTSSKVLQQANNGGTADAFVAKIAPGGGSLLSLSYYGTSAYDQAYFARVDKRGYVYLYGQTCGKDSSLVKNARYAKPNSGQFICKLSTNLDTLVWSTTFGTGVNRPNISPTAMSVDICNRIYVAGVGRDWPTVELGDEIYDSIAGLYMRPFVWLNVMGTTGMDVTPNAFQKITDGKDFYFMVIDEDATRLDYATFYGEQLYGYLYLDPQTQASGAIGCLSNKSASGVDHVDGGTSRFDKRGTIYQSACASCAGCQGFPVFPNPGAWSVTNNSTNCNNAVVAFSIYNDQIQSLFDTIQDLCSPYTVSFWNKSSVVDSLRVNFTWDFGDSSGLSNQKNPTHTYRDTGTYTITLVINDMTSCNLSDTSVMTLTIKDSTLAIRLDTLETCRGNSVLLGDSTLLTNRSVYSWTPAGKVTNDTSLFTRALPDTTTTFRLRVRIGACFHDYTQTVLVRDTNFMAHLVLIGGSGSNTVCAGQPISLAVRANQPHGTVTWASDRLFSQVLVIPPPDSLLVLQATNDTMFYIMTSSTNCGMTRVDSLRITIVDPRIHTSGDTLLCLGESINLYVFNDNQSVNLAYTWLPQEEVVGNPAAQSIRTKPRHDVLFKISARSPEGCIVFDSIKVSVDSARVDTLLFDDVMCHGDSVGRVSIAGHGIAPILYKWNDGSAEPVRDRLLPGRYSVTASDSAGCTSVAHFMISNPSPLAPDATLGYGACKRACNGTIALHVKGGTAPYTYRWDSFDTTSSVQDLCDGTYTVSIIDKNKCRAHRAFTMKSFDKHPALDASANKKTIYRSQAVVLSATPVPSDSVRYSWIPDYTLKTPHSSHTISTPDSTTTFFVTATDQFGCISVDTVSVTVKDFVCDTPFVFVPNVFTPNGDKLNDVVKVQGDVVINLYFAIYDRWGEKIFDTHDQSVGWDGSYRNKPLSPAVFVYYLEATCINNETIRRKGNITLVR